MNGSPETDRGAITLLVATFALIMLASVLVLFDGARRLQNITTAQDLASETARYAAAFINEDSMLTTQFLIDSDTATDHAEAFALSAGASEVTVEVADDFQSVVAIVTIDGGTAFTPGFDLSAQAQHRAFALTTDTP